MPADKDTVRFDEYSGMINLDKLERETRKILLLGFLVAVSFHAALGAYFIYHRSEVKVIKPVMTELVIRKPRMTKPFEFRKERIKKRILTKRIMEQRILPSSGIKLKYLPDLMIGNVKTFEYTNELIIEGEDKYFYIPEKVIIDMSIIRKPDNQISMKEEMMTIDDLDTGRFKAMVIQDPKNRKNIKGFIYIGNLWGTDFTPIMKRSIPNLVDAVNKYTKINAKMDEHVYLDSKKLFKIPMVFIAAKDIFDVNEIELKNFGEYLRNGGFAVLDNANPTLSFAGGEASLRGMLKKSLGSDAKFIPIPNDHPLYHCFFDFDKAPRGSELDETIDVMRLRSGWEPVYYLEGIWLKNRLVAIYSDKGYSISWERDYDNEPQLKMGVNMIVFALTQTGGMAEKLMEQYTEKQ